MRSKHSVMLVGLSVLCLAGVVTAGEVYQWKDANGVTHYSQTPPPKGQFQQRQITSHGTAAPQQTQNDASTQGAVNPQCATARSNVEALTSNKSVHEADADGKPGRVLGDADRANQLELANAAVKAFCNPPAA